MYGVDNPEKILGSYDLYDDVIKVYVDETKTIEETASTIIHELTHRKLGSTNTRKEEVRCFINEHMHKHGTLAFNDVKNIIKLIDHNKFYSELKWR